MKAVKVIVRLFLCFFTGEAAEVSRHPEKSTSAIPQLKRASSELVQAQVLQVLDGDTVIVNCGGECLSIRLSAIDCPENGQEWGDSALYGLIKLIGNRSVRLEIHGADKFGRTVATIYVARDGQIVNVNEHMVKQGHAWVYRYYYDHLPKSRKQRLNQLERWAKSKRVGLWRHNNPTPPWQWRKLG